MQRLKIPFVIMLSLVLVLSSAMVASAAKPEHAGNRGRGKADVAMTVEVVETKPVAEETEEGTPEEATPETDTTEGETTEGEVPEELNPYDLTQMVDKINEIKASLPGKGNAWGRIAKELGFEKAPGSIATLVEQLQLMAGHVEEEETEDAALPEITEPVVVTVMTIECEEGSLTGLITIAWPAADGEEPEVYTIEADAETITLLETGTELELSLDADGNVVINIHEEPAAEGEADGTTPDGAETDGTGTDDTTEAPADDTGAETPADPTEPAADDTTV